MQKKPATIYRIFSRAAVLNIITACITLCMIRFLYRGIMEISASGFSMDSNIGYPAAVLFFCFLAINLWLATVTFFPVIIINKKGIKAVSLFWQRTLLWTEIKATRLLKVDMEMKGAGTSAIKPVVHTRFTNNPVKQWTIGQQTKTFIAIYSKAVILPAPKSMQLLSHRAIAPKGAIVFEFEPAAWQFIQEKING